MSTPKAVKWKLSVRRCISEMADDVSTISHLGDPIKTERRGNNPMRNCVFEELQKLQMRLKEEIASFLASGHLREDGLLSLLDADEGIQKTTRRSDSRQCSERSSDDRNHNVKGRNRSEEIRPYSSESSRTPSPDDVRQTEMPFSIPKLDVDQLESLNTPRIPQMDPKKSFRNEIIQVIAVPSEVRRRTRSVVSSQSESPHSDSATSPELEKFTRKMTAQFLNDPVFMEKFNSEEVDINDVIVDWMKAVVDQPKQKTSTTKMALIPSIPVRIRPENVDKSVQLEEETKKDMATSPPSFGISQSTSSGDGDVSSSLQSSDLSAGQVVVDDTQRRNCQILSVRSDGSMMTSSRKPQVFDSESNRTSLGAAKFAHVHEMWRPSSRILRIEEADLSSSAQDTVSARGISSHSENNGILSNAFRELEISEEGSSADTLPSAPSLANTLSVISPLDDDVIRYTNDLHGEGAARRTSK